MELNDIIVLIIVILAVILAIFNGTVIDIIGEIPLIILEVGLFVVVIVIAIFGQSIFGTKS